MSTPLNRARLEQAADIIAAFVSKNPIPAEDLPSLIAQVHGVIAKLSRNAATAPAPEPAAPINQSVTADFIICLEDGKKFKSMKRHLASVHNMTPGQYRKKWSLPASYPMVAASYSNLRSGLAKANGLGTPNEAGKHQPS